MAAVATTNLDTFVPPADRLTSINYETWKEYMEVNLKRQDLREPIYRRYHPEVTVGTPLKSYSGELNRDKKALEAIQKSCGPDMLLLICYAEFASEAWTWLEEVAGAKDHKKERYIQMVETAATSRANLENVPEVNKVLTKRNYEKWREYMLNELTSKCLWSVVDGTDKNGSRGYKLKNRDALVIIKISCGKEMFNDIYSDDNACDAWCKIEDKLEAWRKSECRPDTFAIERTDSVPIQTSDYKKWSESMQKYLTDKGLWGFLEEPKPDRLDSAKDEKALDVIKLHCPPHMQKFIWYVDCAKSAWKELLAEQDEFAEVHHETRDGEHIIPEAYRVLTRSNYKEWSSHMKLRFQSLRLWSIVNNAKDDSSESISNIKDACALRIIKEACGRHMLFSIFTTDSAHKAWKVLEKDASLEQRDVYSRYSRLLHAVKIDRFGPEEQDPKKEFWRGANYFFRDFPEALTAEITDDGSTTLHVAVRLGRANFVAELLKLMSTAQLEATTIKGNTALSVAAKGYNNLEIVEKMAQINRYLLQIENVEEHNALAIAAINGDEKVFRYLYGVTPTAMLWQSGSIGKRISNLLTSAARIDAFDVVLKILKTLKDEKQEEYVFSRDDYGMNLLTVLAGKPSSFPSGNKFGLIGGIIYRLAGVKPDGILLKALKAIVPCIKIQPLYSKVQHHQTMEIVYRICPLVCNYQPEELNEALINDAIYLATIHGIIEIFKLLIDTNLYLEDVKDNEKRGLFQIAIISRQEKIFEYISQLGQRNQNISLLDSFGNNTLHCAGVWMQSPQLDKADGSRGCCKQLPQLDKADGPAGCCKQSPQLDKEHDHPAGSCKKSPQLDKAHGPAGFWMQSPQLDKAHGPALQMQRELQWFEVVQRVVPPRYREAINKDRMTPKSLFSLHHKGLVEQGEKWMKDTSNACMLVTTLIATVMFAAAFTLPGGSDQNTGRSLIAKSAAFKVFVVCDAVSLFASCTSVLMFFSILTARFAERDFLISLPRKLILGLSTLFISIATMMATFAATLVIVLRGEASWVFIPVCVLASIPVLLFGLLQLPLFYHIVKSTYGRDICRWTRFTFSFLCCRKRLSSSPLICITCCQ
ncbi:hypothetical protein MKX03_037920 [Papaver bracteatum]|nr:hypothetical protein MKX03_037920 [Papaver bracteatum]